MSYKRKALPEVTYKDQDLYARLAGIGFRFAVVPVSQSPIEDTLISAACTAVEEDDRRLWVGLLDWWAVHHPYVNADRLLRALQELNKPKISALFSGLAQGTSPIGRFRGLAGLYRGKRLVLFSEDYRYRLARDGEVERFEHTSLAVPRSLYKESTRDIMTTHEVAMIHRPYYWRIVMGPVYRADLWSACEKGVVRTAYSLASEAYCSISVARKVLIDYRIASRT